MRRVNSVATPVAHLVGPGKLKVINGRLAYSDRSRQPVRLEPEALRAVYCYGDVGVTDEAMTLLFRHHVEVVWLTPAGTRCRGRLVRSDPPTTALRLLQHQACADAGWRRAWACRLVQAKIGSQLQAARHYQRHGRGEAGPVLGQLQEALAACPAAAVEQLRGLEGTATAAWFRLLGRLLQPPWQFAQRVRRPPTDPVNALLSLGYTWLLARTTARCEAAGLEVYLGALHEYRPGRPSLACDLMEPLRVPAVDRWVLAACNEGRLAPGDFREEGGGIRLQPECFGRMLHDWEGHWLEGKHEAALDGIVEELIASLRQRAALPPGGDDGDDL